MSLPGPNGLTAARRETLTTTGPGSGYSRGAASGATWASSVQKGPFMSSLGSSKPSDGLHDGWGRRSWVRLGPCLADEGEGATMELWRSNQRGQMAANFLEARDEFDRLHRHSTTIARSLAPVHGKYVESVAIADAQLRPLEEYYKWQFVYAVTKSGLWAGDCVATEVYFPKGSKTSAPLKIDVALFASPDWSVYYERHRDSKDPEALQWLSENLLAVVEVKRGKDSVQVAFNSQLKQAMREKDPSDSPIIGILYDQGRAWIFHRRAGKYIRYDETKNAKDTKSGLGDLNLHLPDPVLFLPSQTTMLENGSRKAAMLSDRTAQDLSVVSSIEAVQIKDALSAVLRKLDRSSLIN